MKKIAIVVFCSLATVLLHAQIPGFQGKRGVLEVQVTPQIGAYLLSGDAFGLPITYKIHGEYAIKRQKSLGFEYRQMHIGRAEDATVASYDNKTLVLLYTNYNRNWSLAPYGHYLSYGLGYNMRTAKATSPTDTTAYNDNFFSFNFTWGQRYIIGKRLSLNYGFDMSIPLKAPDEAISEWGLTVFGLNLGIGFIF